MASSVDRGLRRTADRLSRLPRTVPGYGRSMAFGKRDDETKPLNQYKSLSVRDQAMVKALSAAIGQEVREALAEHRAALKSEEG